MLLLPTNNNKNNNTIYDKLLINIVNCFIYKLKIHNNVV